MSKNITISYEVYRKLARVKGDRSFGEVIASELQTCGRLADVAGRGVLEPRTHEAVKAEIVRHSEGSATRVDDETP